MAVHGLWGACGVLEGAWWGEVGPPGGTGLCEPAGGRTTSRATIARCRSALTEAQALIDRLHAWRLACAASSAVQQQAEAQPAGRLGERSAAYGAMRDLPASWWRAFRRLPPRS